MIINKKLLVFVLFTVFLQLLFAVDIIVSNGKIKEVNGVYFEQGLYNGKPCYKKGNYEIRYKGCRAKWVLLINGVMYYRNMTNSVYCPLDNWRTACKAKEISDKVPEFEIKITNLPN